MNVYESILTRRSTRNYQQKPVSQKLLTKIIDAEDMRPVVATVKVIILWSLPIKQLKMN